VTAFAPSIGILTRRIFRRFASRWPCSIERRGDKIHEVPVSFRSNVAVQDLDYSTRSTKLVKRKVSSGLDDIAALLDQKDRHVVT